MIMSICLTVIHAQNISISNDGSQPHPSAALDVKATDKGVLVPRVDFNNLPVSPATGLLVYVTANGPDGNNAFYYFDGTQWEKLVGGVTETDPVFGSSAAGGITGSDITNWNSKISSQWTTSGSNIYFNTGNAGIGTTSPKAKLDLGNNAANRKILLYTSADNDHEFTGFGVNFDALRYQIGSIAGNHKFYAATSATTSTEIFRIQGNGQVAIPALTTSGVLVNNSTGIISSSIGTSGQVLTTNGSGGISWTNPNGGTVTSVNGSLPIVSSSGSNPVISINAATILSAGSMSASDKTKLDGIDPNANYYLHPTGDGNLHVPATGTGNNGKVLTAGSTAGSLSWVSPSSGTVTSVSGSAPISVANGTTTPAISISPATTSSAGSMSAADKTRLDGLVSSQWTTSGSNIYYNAGNVGIGSNTPTQKLEVNGSVIIPAGESYWIGNAADAGNRLRLHQNNTNAYIDWGEETLFFRSGATSSTNRVVFTSTGRVGIGTTTPKATLDLGNSTSNRKMVMWQNIDNDHQFYGLGVNSNTFRYQLPGTTDSHVFYAATSSTASDELFRIKGTGEVVIPALTTAGVLLNSASGVISSSVGTNGQVLTTNGSGSLGWITPSSGTVTNVSGTLPISVATGTSTPVISIAAATTSTAGSMSAADKTKLDGMDGSETKLSAGTNVTITGSGTTGSPYVVNAAGVTTLTIGQAYQGGIIFWVDATGQHGLIAATSDQSTGIEWNNGTYTTTNAVRDGIGAGMYNTERIIANQAAGSYAAQLCANYQGGGYGDWYLPSKYELNLLYLARTAVGGFASAYYWSSSEYSFIYAWLQSFVSGGQYYDFKDSASKVRAVRAF